MLDSAVWRRFQTVIELSKPDNDAIMRFVSQFPKVADESSINKLQWRKITESMTDLSYSDIKDIVQNVLKKAILKDKNEIECVDYLVEVFCLRIMQIIIRKKWLSFYTKTVCHRSKLRDTM